MSEEEILAEDFIARCKEAGITSVRFSRFDNSVTDYKAVKSFMFATDALYSGNYKLFVEEDDDDD